MRHVAMPLFCLTLAALVSACGSTAAPLQPLKPITQGFAAQATKVTEGHLIFNKDLVYKTIDILGVGAVYQAKLEAEGIKNCNELLMAAGGRTDRKHLAEKTGISPKLILTWVNHADLVRVIGCGPEYARLLELAGVDTVVELAKRNSINLTNELRTSNVLGGGRVAVKRLPSVITVTAWSDNAAKFARLVTY